MGPASLLGHKWRGRGDARSSVLLLVHTVTLKSPKSAARGHFGVSRWQGEQRARSSEEPGVCKALLPPPGWCDSGVLAASPSPRGEAEREGEGSSLHAERQQLFIFSEEKALLSEQERRRD